MADNSGYVGFQDADSTSSDHQAMSFLVKQMISRVHTATVVKVVAVTNAGALAPSGFVDVVPMVNQIDGAGRATPHGTVHHLPYSRMQGGTNAVVMDPKVGDLGIVVFASRDISAVKNNKAQSNPGSFRRHNMADGMYVGGLLNGTPEQYVQFTDAGITLHSPQKVTINAPTIELVGNVQSTGTFLNNGANIGSSHRHNDPQGGTSGGPI